VLSAIGSPLVAGSAPSMQKTRHVRVVRAFFPGKGKALEVGAVVELPAYIAAEAVHSNKAVFVEPPAPAVEEPPAAVEPVQALEPKGKKFNARK
jgi:hypothetical protein